MNRDKTEQSIFETGINCDTETAYQDMMSSKRRWGKADRKRQGYHIIQSFAPGEITPEEAHAVGVEFAQQLLGDHYEIIVTTHLDKDHLHNHIVFNSVSFMGGIMYEDEFVQQVTNNALTEQMKQQAAAKRQLEQQTRRIGEIDTIIQRLYEDNVAGKLPDERFSKMYDTYEKEQKQLQISTNELQATIEAYEQQKVNVKSFLKLVKSYIEPEELTPEVLRMFIEKVVVHAPYRQDKRRHQQIDIYYNFVGQFDMSVETAKTGRSTKAEMETRRLANN